MFFGERPCDATYESGNNKGKRCSKKAYYKCGKRYVCGIHSTDSRTKLPKNPNKAQEKAEQLANHKVRINKNKLNILIGFYVAFDFYIWGALDRLIFDFHVKGKR